MFIFDELGWNFEPSELGAAFGLQQLKKLSKNYDRRQRNFTMYTEFFSDHADQFVVPRQLAELNTAWLCYPVTIQADAGFTRSDLQQYLDDHDVDTRTIWTGNAVRQPMMKGVDFRAPSGGMPNADLVMEGGIILPCSHAVGDEGIDYVCEQIEGFLALPR